MRRQRIVLVLCAVFALGVGVGTANAGQGGNSANLALSSDVLTCPGFPGNLCFGTLNGNGLAPGSLVRVEGFFSIDGTLAFVLQRPVDAKGRVHFPGLISCDVDNQPPQFAAYNFSASATTAAGTTIASNVIINSPC